MGHLRTPFVFIAVALLLIVLLLDVGGGPLLSAIVQGGGNAPPGRGVPALAFLDGLLFLQVALLAADAVRAGRIARWVNGPGVLVVSILVILGAIMLAFTVFGLVLLMVSIFMAVPFGPAIYIGIWGDFERTAALSILSTTLTLRVLAGIALVLYDQTMLKKTRMLLLFFTCLVGDLIVSFLLSMVPTILCSITDGIAAIVIAVLGIIWAIILLIPGAIGTLRLIRLRA